MNKSIPLIAILFSSMFILSAIAQVAENEAEAGLEAVELHRKLVKP